MEDTEDFDSWIQEQERILHIQHNNNREFVSKINCYYIYINVNQCIDHIVKDSFVLDFSGCIPFTGFLTKVKNKCKCFSTVNTKYVYKESLMYFVDLEPEHVQEFSQLNVDNTHFLEYSKRFLKVLSPLEDIHVDKSIFIFHPLNTLYILLQEIVHKHKRELKLSMICNDALSKTPINLQRYKSILKSNSNTNLEKTKTHKNLDNNIKKKVSIKLQPIVDSKILYTRKHRPTAELTAEPTAELTT